MRNLSVFSLALIGTVALLFITSFALSQEIPFPTTHPPTAVSDTWPSGYGDSFFSIYVWRENGQVWIEIEPLLDYPAYPFICGSSFNFVQNGVQLTDYPVLEVSNGDWFCDYLYVDTVFRLKKVDDLPYIDDPQAFTLYYYHALSQTYSLDIPAEVAAPIADFTTNPISGFIPLTVNFTDQSTGQITSWSWDFGDSSTSTEQNPTHIYDDYGTYTVSLTVTGPGGSDMETKADYINVRERKAMPWIPLLLLDE